MSTNPLLEDLDQGAITSVSIHLPTSGYFYPKGSGIIDDDADVTDLEIKPLGILAEQLARDPFIVASGKGIPRILQQICPAIKKPEEMCEIDIEAILLACRLASYGHEMKMASVCQNPKTREEETEEGKPVSVPECTHETEIVVDLYQHMQRYAPLEDMEDLIVELPELNNQVVHMKPMCYQAALTIIKNSVAVNQAYSTIENRDASAILEDETVLSDYEKIVDSSADTKFELTLGSIFYVANSRGEKTADPKFIREWLEMLPPLLTERIQKVAREYNDKLANSTKIEYQCPECGHKNTLIMELDPQKIFFYESDASKAEKSSSSTSQKNEKPKSGQSKTSPRSAKRSRARSATRTSKSTPQEKSKS